MYCFIDKSRTWYDNNHKFSFLISLWLFSESPYVDTCVLGFSEKNTHFFMNIFSILSSKIVVFRWVA